MTGVLAMRAFSRFAKKEGLGNTALLRAAKEVSEGRPDADLGGGVFKQRIARQGSGKSGGYRAIIFFRMGGRCILAHGFSKADQANLSSRELTALKKIAKTLLNMDQSALVQLCDQGLLEAVKDDGDGEGE
jgi:hypothetical protein